MQVELRLACVGRCEDGESCGISATFLVSF